MRWWFCIYLNWLLEVLACLCRVCFRLDSWWLVIRVCCNVCLCWAMICVVGCFICGSILLYFCCLFVVWLICCVNFAVGVSCLIVLFDLLWSFAFMICWICLWISDCLWFVVVMIYLLLWLIWLLRPVWFLGIVIG